MANYNNGVGGGTVMLAFLLGAVAGAAAALLFAPASGEETREYLGETHLAMGNLKGAQEQLGLLERLKATEEHAQLKTAIDTWLAAHPQTETPETPKSSEGSASGEGQTKP